MNVQWRILGTIFGVLRLEVSVWISLTIRKGLWFSPRFSSFLLYSVQLRSVETVRGCASLNKEKSQGKAVEVTLKSKDENS
jgi:hypothetical protein